MEYRQYTPCEVLAPYVECYWILEGDVDESSATREKILPDGCMELIINYGEPFRYWRDSHSSERQPTSFVVGQMSRHIEIQPVRPAGVIGVRFHPGGSYPFLRFSQWELNDQVVALDGIWNGLARTLEERINEASTDHQRIAVIREVLIERLRSAPAAEATIAKIVDRVVSLHGLVTVDDLAWCAGLSSRQLERRFKQEVGLTPKLLCRILRFQTIFSAYIQNDGARLAALAAHCGYYDQSHFIRDFRQFSGQDPSSFFSNESQLTRYFTRADRMSDLYNPDEDT